MFTPRFYVVSLTGNSSRDMDRVTFFLITQSFFQMVSEADYVSLKSLKSQSPEEKTRWHSVQEERRAPLLPYTLPASLNGKPGY